MLITLDFETKSYADLKKVGSWVYSEDPTTDIICLCWAVDDGPVEAWVPSRDGLAIPPRLAKAIEEADEIEAHNVAFEIGIWVNICVARLCWPEIPMHKWRDSMATAAYYSMPPGLDNLVRVLFKQQKNADGTRLISKYSKLHLKTAKEHIPDHEWVEWRDMTPTEREANPGAKEAGGYFNEDMQKFVDYCSDDVRLERRVGEYLGELPDEELIVFLHDLAVCYRGLYLDAEGIAAASAIIDQREAELADQFREITGLNPTQRDAIMRWCEEQGHQLENLQKDYIEELLDEQDFPQGVARDALTIRLKYAKASTKKLDAMARQRGANGRARFQTRYHGANTGRNTGTGFQPLNLSRGYEDEPPQRLVDNILYGSPRYLDLVYGDAMEAVSAASRHWIMAEPGNIIRAGDYVSIEAVLLACIAGEEWKVQAFRDGVKIYEHMADKIYNFPAGTVTKATHPQHRQDGKTGELAFGYQGALGAWLKFDSSGRHSDDEIMEICRAWRTEHPAVVGLWAGLEEAAFLAVTHRGAAYGFRGIEFEIIDDWLTMRLLNGKRLWYAKPMIKRAMPAWHKPLTDPDCAAGICHCRERPQLSYMSQKTGSWRSVYTYGGKLTENCIQAHARELLKPAEMRVQAAGYDVILSVYDEIVTESPVDFGSTEEFMELMREKPEWASGWPVRVDPWEGERYKK